MNQIKTIGKIIKFLLVLVAIGLFAAALIMPLVRCNFVCTGTDTEAWMPAFFYAPFGIASIREFLKMTRALKGE